jgi:hypothetical protein
VDGTPARIGSVYSEVASLRRNPQLRQKRNSAGITERQFEHVIKLDVGSIDDGISGF